MFEQVLLDVARAISVQVPILIPGIFFILAIKKNWLAWSNKPIDFGTGLFGENKNWRGAIFYIFGAILVTYPMHLLSLSQAWVAPVFQANWWLLGFSFGSAYVLGELVNSFIKRRIGIKPGAQPGSIVGKYLQAFFDNADGALACGLVLTFGFNGEQSYLVIALFISLAIHASTDIWMRKLKLKKK